MYLVELKPGKEELYRSSDELALAIRNGDVDARSRVYHRATAKWISITLHPQYKAIVAASKEDSAARILRRGWNIISGGGGQAAESSPSEGSTPGGTVLHRWRRPMALGISALLLLSGLQLAFWGPRPPWTHPSQRATIKGHSRTTEGTQNAKNAESSDQERRLVSLVGAPASWPLNDQPAGEPVPPKRRWRRNVPVLPRAPQMEAGSLRQALVPDSTRMVQRGTLEALLAGYTAAHDSARARLERSFRLVRLSRLFAAPRLSANGGVADARVSLAGAVTFIRRFRQQQTTIEAAYQDSVTTLAQRNGVSPKKVRQWYSRPEQREGPALELISGSLLASVDSVLGVLETQAGAYKIRGNAIAFADPTAGLRYGALRRRVKEQIDAAVAAGGASSGGPAALLLQAIGTTNLPRET